jgi:hypothetical protein
LFLRPFLFNHLLIDAIASLSDCGAAGKFSRDVDVPGAKNVSGAILVSFSGVVRDLPEMTGLAKRGDPVRHDGAMGAFRQWAGWAGRAQGTASVQPICPGHT